MVVINAIIARVLLKERLQRCDYHGGALICSGIAVTANFAPYVTKSYNAREISALVADPYGALYAAILLFVAIILSCLVFYHERLGARDESHAVLEGVPVPRTRPCPGASSSEVEMRSSAKPPAKLKSVGLGFGGGGGGELHVACTVMPSASPAGASSAPSAAVPTSPPSSPPACAPARANDALLFSPPPSPPGCMASPAGQPANGDVAPSLYDATTAVGGSSRVCHGAVAASPMTSPDGGGRSAAAGRGFGGGDSSSSPRRRRKSFLTQLMPFAYPVILGILETLVQMSQKAASSMALLTLGGESQMCHPTFWVSWLLLALLTVFVIWWLRKGLSHLEASRLLPVEYGTVTSTSIVGGLVIYKEWELVSPFSRGMMGVGILLILIGCALVGRRKTIKKRFDPGYKITHDYLPRLKTQLNLHTGLHAQHHRRTASDRPTERTERSSAALCRRAASAPSGGPGALPSEVRVTLDDAAPSRLRPAYEAAASAQATTSPHRDSPSPLTSDFAPVTPGLT